MLKQSTKEFDRLDRFFKPRLLAPSQVFRAYRLPPDAFSASIEEFFIALNTPVSLSCLILYRHGEFKQLVEKEIDPGQYNDPYRFRDDYSAISFLRKNDFLETGIDREAVALKKFEQTEADCRDVNRRFKKLAADPKFRGPNVWLLNAVTRKIARILGNFPVETFFDEASWGPGVTTLIKGKDTSASRKFREENEITSSAYLLVAGLAEKAYPGWFPDISLNLAQGNKVITVPKNAKTDRTIAVEPGLNSWFQLGVGRCLRRRLRTAGFDLNSDRKNQAFAKLGSLTGEIATVDFSSASDTISTEVVREILPLDWFTVCDALRSHCYEREGVLQPWRKFSAMGNGFTFELESLIFLTSALAVCEYLGLNDDQVSIFGDDVTIPSDAFPLYAEFCSFLGFTVNRDKSFCHGYFRESCGSYYFNGIDVKPLFLKKVVRDAKATYIMANSIRRLAHSRNSNYGCDERLLPVWKSLVRRLPKCLRHLGPASAGDSVLHANLDEATPSLCRNRRETYGWEGYNFSGFLTVPVSREDDHSGVLLARLWRPSRDRPSGNSVDLRAVTKTVFKKRLFAPQWYNFGPWI